VRVKREGKEVEEKRKEEKKKSLPLPLPSSPSTLGRVLFSLLYTESTRVQRRIVR